MGKCIQMLAAYIAVTLIAAPASAEWTKAENTDRNGSVWIADFDNIRDDGETVTAWIEVDHSNDRTVREHRSMLFYRMNCEDDTYRLLSATLYGSDGDVLRSARQTDLSFYTREHYTPVVPGSVLEYMYNQVCSYVNLNGARR